jgi:hypothetical protein
MAISLHRDSTYLDHDQALSRGGESKEGVHRPTSLMILTDPTSGLISAFVAFCAKSQDREVCY